MYSMGASQMNGLRAPVQWEVVSVQLIQREGYGIQAVTTTLEMYNAWQQGEDKC